VEHDWKDFANDPLFDETTTQTGAEWILTAGGMGKNSKGAKRFNTWSLDALRALEWKRFELVCARYYELVGFQPKTTGAGADGGIDIRLFKTDPAKPIAIVQCKAWNASDIDVKEIRELLCVIASEKVSRGIFITTGCYTREARDFGEANPMQLLDGATFLSKISEMPPDQQDSLLKFAFDGDFSTPTCASCGIKMVKRDSKHGPFWGCLNFPRCRSKFHIRQ
jgi:restriction system protein